MLIRNIGNNWFAYEVTSDPGVIEFVNVHKYAWNPVSQTKGALLETSTVWMHGTLFSSEIQNPQDRLIAETAFLMPGMNYQTENAITSRFFNDHDRIADAFNYQDYFGRDHRNGPVKLGH